MNTTPAEEPTVDKPKMVSPKMILRFPHLLALSDAMPINGSGLPFVAALRLSGIATMWFEALNAIPSFLCPQCGCLWSTPEKQAACAHTDRSGIPIREQANAEQRKTIEGWMLEAKERS